MQTKQLANQLNTPARLFCGLATVNWITRVEELDKALQPPPRPLDDRKKYTPNTKGQFELDAKTKRQFIKLWNGGKHSMARIREELDLSEWVARKVRDQLLDAGEIQPRKRPHIKQKVRHD